MTGHSRHVADHRSFRFAGEDHRSFRFAGEAHAVPTFDDERKKIPMRKSFALKSVATIAGSCALFASLSGFTLTDTDEVNAADAVAAIRIVVPESLSNVAPVNSDADVAAEASVPGGTITVPVDPSEGISLGDSVTIGLPFAQQASDATDSPLAGVVAFNNNNGSTTVPFVLSDGATQINTVIENVDAPHRYDYPIDLPAGASLTADGQGTIAAVAADGAPLTVFGEAWAKDANGAPVPTHYELHGNTLTQVVDFTEATAFPVVADPATTGVYSYNCVNPNGSSYFMKPNENLTNCRGSYLQKYINGRMVQSLSLVYRGGAYVKPTWRSGCVLALGGATVALVWFPPAGVTAWVVTSAFAAAGIAGSCKGF
ncbi:hypothetical protein ACRAWB_03580 [Leifsonia poae]|uniref:hypothetical protein n=1 Tax=Leifsonia poae TaxID=110933 RepID=UPI003D68FC1D